MIAQCSVIKDACSIEPEEQFDTLFTQTQDLADFYVVLVDRSSKDATLERTHQALERVRLDTGKPAYIEEFDWNDSFSEPYNKAFELAEGAGAEWTLRVDSDIRFTDASKVRGFLDNCSGSVIKMISKRKYTDINSILLIPFIVNFPAIAMKANVRQMGRIYETPEHPRPLVLRERETAPIEMRETKQFRREDSSEYYYIDLCEMEVPELYKMLHNSDSPEDIFRVAARFNSLGSVAVLEKRSKPWRRTAFELFKSLAERGYEPGDCYQRMSVLSLAEGRPGDSKRYGDMAKELIGKWMERSAMQWRDAYEAIKPGITDHPDFKQYQNEFF